MKWSCCVALVLISAACAPPDPPDAWTVERLAVESAATQTTVAVCTDISELALGSMADETDLEPVLAELARIGAQVGATAALPALNRAAEFTGHAADDTEALQLHNDLVAASSSIDAATFATCRIPLFTALYSATGWGSCHGELDIPVAGYTVFDPDRGCTVDGVAEFLPCWSEEGPLPIDCNTGEVVQVIAGRWQSAGEPRLVEPPQVDSHDEDEPEAIPQPPPVVPISSPECSALADLFTGPQPLDGASQDLSRVESATASLGAEIVTLIEEFVAATNEAPDIADYEALILALDNATANRCGIPLISAWDLLTGGIEELPCWMPTGVAFPAHTLVDC